MPRIAVISDLHANLEACEAVRDEILSDGSLQEIYCLGDFVGYGPSPNEVVRMIRGLEENGIRMRHALGNHDAAATGRCEFVDLHDDQTLQRVCEEGAFADRTDIIRAYLNPGTRKYVPVKPEAAQAMEWTLRQMTDETRAFLDERLEERIEIQPNVIAVHASPRDVSYEYVRDTKSVTKAFEAQMMDGVGICFHGHTHLPVTWCLPADERVSYAGSTIVTGQVESNYDEVVEIDLERNVYLINVGSVGQARGEDRRAGYVIYDPDASTVEFRRVGYDATTTVAKIREAGLPDGLAGRFGGGEDVDV